MAESGSDDLTPTRDEVIQAVKKEYGTEDVNLVEYTIRPASDKPMGFLGDHLRIQGTVQYSGEIKKFQYFAKIIPTKIASHREYAEKTRAFYKEIEMYKTLFDDMKKAQSPERTKFKWRPECYFTRDWDAVVVEDLSPKDYYMLPERTRMGLEYVKETIKTLARMHADTFIFEAKLNAGKTTTHSKLYKVGGGPFEIRNLYPHLLFESECIKEEGHPGYTFWEVGIESQKVLIDLIPGFTTEQKKVFRDRFTDLMRDVYALTLPSSKYKNVITHGDIWGNNILFKDGPDGKVNEAVYVDFQMTRYSPPAQDFLLILHVIQGRAFREEHEKNLIELYYTTLSEGLTAAGLRIEDVLPRKEFDESLQYYRKFAIITNIIYTQLNQTPPDVCAEFLSTPELYHKVMFEDRSDMLLASYTSDALCREKTVEVMQEFASYFGII